MTAGRGVTHTERTPTSRRDGQELLMHGYQIWVALPKEMEEMEPRFDYYPNSEVPQKTIGNVTIKVAAGNAFGLSAPLQGYSPLFMVDISAKERTTLDLRGQIKGEVAFVIVKGAILSDNQEIKAGQMLISKTDDECEICVDANSQILLFGGESLPEERFLSWNFVSHSKDRLKQAKEDWINKAFPKVPGDDTYIPFPDFRRR